MPFYGLYIPAKCGSGSASAAAASGLTQPAESTDQNQAESPYVFRVKSEALDVLKQHKDARLREFSIEEDAVKYAQTGFEVVQSKYSDVKTSTAAMEKAIFRGPTKQEFIEFRKMIEAGDYERVKSIVWDNPRYLVSSGDTPTTLKEGYRYNAMHVCAIAKKPRIAELLLQTVSDPVFVDLLTGKKNDLKMCKELCINLLDYYLNIPEKGRSETPLHFASKNGCIDMIEVLTSYPECKMTRNSDGLLPKEIICTRFPQSTPELCKKILLLLEDRFYVPVLRSIDNAIPPQIGQPFSASDPPSLNTDPLSSEVKIDALAGPMNKDHAKQFHRRWKTPPRIGSNITSPLVYNPSYISPMKPRGGGCHNDSSSKYANDTFTPIVQRRTIFNSTPKHSTPTLLRAQSVSGHSDADAAETIDKQNGNHVPEIKVERSVTFEANNNNHGDEEAPQEEEEAKSKLNAPKMTTFFPTTPILRNKKELFFTYREQYAASPLLDADDSLDERNGPLGATPGLKRLPGKIHLRTPLLRSKHTLLFTNSSPNLSTGCDDPPMDGIDPVVERADASDSAMTAGFKERHVKISDIEKGLEIVGRELAKEQNVGWREYWDFLNVFIDIAGSDGLQRLENYFAERARESEVTKKTARSAMMLDNVCNVLEKMEFSKDSVIGRNGFHNDSNRLALAPTGTSAVAGSAPQATTPYTCVEKSLQVFAKRMTKTIILNIENVVSINDTLLSELKRLKSLICSFMEDTRFINVNFAKVHSRIGNLVSIYLENSQEVSAVVKAKIQNIMQSLLLTPGDRREHIECVCNRIQDILDQSADRVLPENLKTERMCEKVWLGEKECECQWETNLSRKTSRRNRMEARYKSHQDAQQQEKTAAAATETTAVAKNFTEWRDRGSTYDDDDDVFWSDFGGSDTDDDDDVWLTPPESVSRMSLTGELDEDAYKVFIYGNEPTKRDLDVLNAIFHVDLDKSKYPNIHSWKTALLGYPNEEMDYFPSPSIVRKSHSFGAQNTLPKKYPTTPQQHKLLNAKSYGLKLSVTTTPQTPQSPLGASKQPQLPMAKRLFMSPARNAAKHTVTQTIEQQTQSFTTPLNKIRGLFSAYRDRLESNSTPSSFSSPARETSRKDSDGSNNISLLNISASE